MAPSPAPRSTSMMIITPSRTPTTSKRSKGHTPHRLVGALQLASPLPLEHPVEVVGRIREHPEGADKPSAIQIIQNGKAVRIKTDQGYRDFSFDGVSLADKEDLQEFYKKYVETRIHSVKLGDRCTVMMYGPTAAGKSHTMFGSAKEPGIAYRALQHIMSNSHADENSPGVSDGKPKVKVTVLEVYNEEIFDLLAGNIMTERRKPNTCRVRLEVIGKKPKNAVSISGSDADKITKEIAKVEKKRVVKSTLCNERSSRSHCMVTLDVPSVGGRLVLVDMAGSENIDQAGVGAETKLQTGKINQGNVALKRVVEAIANGDAYIPFRDSKLTMLLQDSFEDDRAKILMVLCASPDFRDIHKTLGTLEYGAKAKCIVRLPISPARDRFVLGEETELSMLEKKVCAMDDYISKLQQENRLKDSEKEGIGNELMRREKDLADLREKIMEMEQERREGKESGGQDNAIRLTLERKLTECQKMVNDFLEYGERKLEEHIVKQRQEVNWIHSQMEEIEKKLKYLERIECIQVVPKVGSYLEIKDQVDGEILNKSREILQQVEVVKIGSQQSTQRKFNLFGLQEVSNVANQSENVSNDLYRTEPVCSINHVPVDREENACGLMRIKLCSSQGAYPCEQAQSSTVVTFAHSPSLGADAHSLEDSGVIVTKEESKDIPISSSLATGDKHEEVCGNILVSSRESVSDDTTFLPIDSVVKQSKYLPHFEFRARGELFSKGSFDDCENEYDDFGHGEFERTGWLPTIPEESEEGEERIPDNYDMYIDKHVEAVTFSINLEESDDKVTDRSTTGLLGHDGKQENLSHDGKQEKPLDELKKSETLSDLATIECALSARSLFFRTIVEPEAEKESVLDKQLCSGRGSTPVTGDSETNKHHAAAAARKSRIENIFLLCGNHRELTAHKHIKDPVQMNDFDARFVSDGSLADPSTTPLQSEHLEKHTQIIAAYSTADSKASAHTQFLKNSLTANITPGRVREMDTSPVTSDFQIPSTRSMLEASENFSPCETFALHNSMPPRNFIVAGSLSTRSMLTSANVKENQILAELDNERCDVYVKWETAQDTSRKLIHVIRITKNSSLEDLRKSIEPYIPDINKEFSFLMLGDPSGAPVEKDKEASLQVKSLPVCHNQKGSRLACLRIPVRCTLTIDPFRALENQISVKSKLASNQCGQIVTPSAISCKSSIKSGSGNSGIVRRINQKPNLQLGSQVKGLRL